MIDPMRRRQASSETRRAGTLLGFDLGTVRTGVAVGERSTGTASPLTTLRAVRKAPDWEGIARLIDEWRPVELVVGLPLNMDGTDNDMTVRARRFSRQLHGRTRLPVHLADERLTTVEAASRLHDNGTFPDRNDGMVDALAAQIILETWLAEAPQ